jgi:transposase-like protein
MAENTFEDKRTGHDEWREQMAAQERSGLSVRRFCQQQGIAEHRFYYWRKQPMRFALVDRGAERPEPAPGTELELVLVTGEQLRIGAGVQAATLRMVLKALRA